MSKNIFLNMDELAEVLEREKDKGKKVVLTNGCFDILHVGHVRYLKEAAEYGDILVTAVNDDNSTLDLKGPPRPIMPAEERAEIVSSLHMVDYTLIFKHRMVDQVIIRLRPHIHAKGTDYRVDNVPELETSQKVGCRTVITGDPKNHSSSEIISKMSGMDNEDIIEEGEID